MTGGQQTGPPDDWSSHADSGSLWKVWSSFYYHSRASHRGDVPCYVWNDCGCGNIQPSGTCFLHILFNLMFSVLEGSGLRRLKTASGCFAIIGCGIIFIHVFLQSQSFLS